MAELIEYKCPNCGGGLEFSSALQKMKCPYCDSEFEVEALKAYDEALNAADAPDELDWDTDSVGEWSAGEAANMRVYVCQSCGGEVVGDQNTAADRCPFCGNPVVMKEQFTGGLKPDCLIPFKLDKDAAMKGFRNHLSDKKLVPNVFKSDTHINEIKGVYVPFWLFDAEVDANILYKATKAHRFTEGDYNCTETSYYSVSRSGQLSFSNVPVDGSSSMADDLIESIEPYDYSELVDFQTAYLAGYLADRYDVTAEQCVDRANERVRASAEKALADTVDGYDSVSPQKTSIRLNNGKAKYALCPVWLLSTTWEGQVYTFAMNGQTGRFIGDLPMDKKKYWLWSLLYALGIGAVIFLLALMAKSSGCI